ncbi:hypothetical protein Ddc_10512 [Ditylenchus destructor]|nr:hypothetical protein Ddc_10512 [Ditylenchus destructor]
MCCSSDEFVKDHPVAAQTIECLVGMIISPWWLFLGCGPLALMLCLSCCGVCAMIVSENYIKYERPVTAHAIDRFWIRIAASFCVLVFFVAPIVVIVLVEERKISPWWLFLGCGPLALMLCLSCCAVCAKIAFDHLFEDLCETDSSLTESASV